MSKIENPKILLSKKIKKITTCVGNFFYCFFQKITKPPTLCSVLNV